MPAAISNKAGTAFFSIAKRGRAANHLASLTGSSQTGGSRKVEVVPTLTADSLLESLLPPDVVKIDVEGAEVLVLSGMERLLSEIRPRIYCEVSQENRDAVSRILASHRYRIAGNSGANILLKPM